MYVCVREHCPCKKHFAPFLLVPLAALHLDRASLGQGPDRIYVLDVARHGVPRRSQRPRPAPNKQPTTPTAPTTTPHPSPFVEACIPAAALLVDEAAAPEVAEPDLDALPEAPDPEAEAPVPDTDAAERVAVLTVDVAGTEVVATPFSTWK
jgi:hypothetical protein